MATLFPRSNSYAYTIMEKEDPNERIHREAQFLIYKTLKQVDQITTIRRRSTRPSWLRFRICKLKVKIGKRLVRLRKTMLLNMVKSKMGVYKHVLGHLKSFKRLFQVGGPEGAATVRCLPRPLIT